MGKFYRQTYRKITSQEYGVIERGLKRNVSLLQVEVKEGLVPVGVSIGRISFDVKGWKDAFVGIIKWFVSSKEDSVIELVESVGLSWISKGGPKDSVNHDVGGGWYVDISVRDAALVLRLRMFVTGLGISANDITFSFVTDSPTLKEKKTYTIEDVPTPLFDTAQNAFIVSEDGNTRLLAPAGAGKTLTMLYRCREILLRDKNARVLLVTFTRAARDEIKFRLNTRKDFVDISARIVVTTLNQYGFKLLKKKFSSCRMLVDKRERKFVLGNQLRIVAKESKSVQKIMGVKRDVVNKSPKIMDLMDSLKSLGLNHQKIKRKEDFEKWHIQTCESELSDLYYAQIEKMENIGLLPRHNKESYTVKQLYDGYIRFHCAACRALKDMNFFTLEDQKYWGWLLLQDSPKVSGAVRYSHVMVDELQDINPLDMRFISAIVRQHEATLAIVGDDDQTIFEWRGATPSYILDPDLYFKDVNGYGKFKTFILNKNYRSPKNIVEMSQKLIAHNKNRVKKRVLPNQKGNASIQIVEGEYDAIVRRVTEDVNDDKIKSIAVISRKKSQLIPYQIMFASKKIDFYAAEDLNVFLTNAFNSLRSLVLIKTRQKQIFVSKIDMVDDITLLFNHIHRYPMNNADQSLFKSKLLAFDCCDYLEFVEVIRRMEKFGRFKDMIQSANILTAYFESKTVEEMLDCIGENFDGFKQDFQKADDDIFYADPPFGELAKFSIRYGDDFMKFYRDIEVAVTTLAAVVHDTDDEVVVDDSFRTKLHLMTALRTKGKEFDSVYILRSNIDTWPIKKAATPARLEAERRLFYVAVTRARKKLVFTKSAGVSSPYLEEMGLEDEVIVDHSVETEKEDYVSKLGLTEDDWKTDPFLIAIAARAKEKHEAKAK
jgi:DNA helicase-2/ATP-dependent DNA helicase PcrA